MTALKRRVSATLVKTFTGVPVTSRHRLKRSGKTSRRHIEENVPSQGNGSSRKAWIGSIGLFVKPHLALSACHVVAPLILLDTRLALGALLRISQDPVRRLALILTLLLPQR